MKFLALTHTAHKIHDVSIQDTEAQGLKYLADYIYANMDPADQESARQADEPMKVSMDIEGNGTKNVFCWRTSILKDEQKTEGISQRWKTDRGVENGVVSFLVEVPDDCRYFVFPMGYSDSFDLVTVSTDPYQNYAFYTDFVVAQNMANQMYAGINRKMKKDLTADNATGTFYEEYQTRELGYDNVTGQHYTRVEVLDIETAVNGGTEDDTATDTTTQDTTATVAAPAPTPAPAAQATPAPAASPAPATSNKKLVPPNPVPVVPLTGGAKIDTAYLKNWIENVIVNSKVLSGNYAVTITRDYKSSTMKPYVTGNAVGFKGLVDSKKYPAKVDYRGFTVKIDVGNNTVYEGKVHIVSSDTLIAGVGIEATNKTTADTVFDNIFTNASTNDPKAAGVSKGSLAKMPVTTCVFIQTVDKTKTRMVPTQLLPSEVEGLKEFIADNTKGLPERVEFAINDKFGMEWSDVASVVGAMFITMDAKIDTVGLVNLPNSGAATTPTASTAPTSTNTPAQTSPAQTSPAQPAGVITLPANPTLADVAKVLELSYADQEWSAGYALTVTGFAGNVKKGSAGTLQALQDGLISEAVEYAAYRQGDYKDESSQKFKDLYTNTPDCWEVKVKTQPQNGGAPFWTLQILVENTTREVVGYTFMNGFNSTKLPITPITTFVLNGLGTQATSTTPVPPAQNGQQMVVTATPSGTTTNTSGTLNWTPVTQGLPGTYIYHGMLVEDTNNWSWDDAMKASNTLLSNQLYDGNFDLATWQPNIFYAKADFDRDATNGLLDGLCYEDYYRQNCDCERVEDVTSEYLPKPGQTLQDYDGEYSCDNSWWDPNRTYVPTNFKVYHHCGVDTGTYPCYDVYLGVDEDTKEIVWFTDHHD